VANGLSSGYMTDAGAREMFANPSAPTAGIAAPAGSAVRVPGGVRVSGRWPFASGITHCDWLWAGCLVMENGQPRMTPMGPDILHVCLPVSDVQVHDTWYVSGLSGTGSNDFSANEVFVPEHRTFRLLDPTGHRPEPLYQMPPLATFAAHLVCVSLGIARAALDELRDIAQKKAPTLHLAVLADKAVTQVEFARAEGVLAAARALHFDVMEEMFQTVAAGGTPTSKQVAMARIAGIQVVEAAAKAAHTANVLAGGSSIYAASSLQRHARDAEVIQHHFTVAPHVWEDAGRVLLGREPLAAAF
jgi:alkylation response protein AidB-like acyl-CoA dehydrogenase